MALPVIQEEDDLVIFMTAQCNSNCVMCPMSEDARRNDSAFNQDEWEESMLTLDPALQHITITGGEPFLEFDRLLWVMDYINSRCPQVPVLILTNGRALCLPDIQLRLRPRITPRYRFGIPVHASTAHLHDRISQSPGSFVQTLNGLHFLASTPAEIEIRLVCHQINAQDLTAACTMLAESHLRITRLNLVAMEMNGCAAKNRLMLWAPYRELFLLAEPGVQELISMGIDVGLYNFPLCLLPKRAWAMAKRSISPAKVRYEVACDDCVVKEACSGFFRSTFLLQLSEAHPIRKEAAE